MDNSADRTLELSGRSHYRAQRLMIVMTTVPPSSEPSSRHDPGTGQYRHHVYSRPQCYWRFR